jgi:hypothetical protein
MPKTTFEFDVAPSAASRGTDQAQYDVKAVSNRAVLAEDHGFDPDNPPQNAVVTKVVFSAVPDDVKIKEVEVCSWNPTKVCVTLSNGQRKCF